jgi:hypothetical protein
MASFLNFHPECLAHHDLAAERDDWKEYSDYLNRCWEYVGEVSTYGWLPRAHRQFGPKVLILRDPLEINKSVERILGRSAGLEPLIKAAEDARAWAEKHGALVIKFPQVFTLDGLALVWDHIFDRTVPFPVEKAKIAITMNTQRHDPKKAFGDARYVRQRLLSPCTDTKPS